MKKIDPWLASQAHEQAVAGLKARIAQLESPAPQVRPGSEGWWWRLYNGKNGPEWDIGEARVIYWEESAEPEQERLLAWTSGGCWTRCDKINALRDSGTRWFKQESPIIRHNADVDARRDKTPNPSDG